MFFDIHSARRDLSVGWSEEGILDRLGFTRQYGYMYILSCLGW
jgi:hypothetical protein